MHKCLLILLFSIAIKNAKAQELKARVTVNATRIGNNVNRNVFLTLQTALNNFLNNLSNEWQIIIFYGNKNGKYIIRSANNGIAAIIIAGIIIIRVTAEPGIEAIEAVNPAKTGSQSSRRRVTP